LIFPLSRLRRQVQKLGSKSMLLNNVACPGGYRDTQPGEVPYLRHGISGCLFFLPTFDPDGVALTDIAQQKGEDRGDESLSEK
jgi:hypothetical protein